MTFRIVNRPAILAALLLAAGIAITAATTPGSASSDHSDNLPGYPYPTFSSVSR